MIPNNKITKYMKLLFDVHTIQQEGNHLVKQSKSVVEK